MFERLDSHSRHVFELAQHEARNLHHNYVGTEHLLLALAIAAGPTAELLARRDCGPAAVRAEIVSMIGRGRPPQREPDALLASLGIDLGEVRRRVESSFGPEAVTKAVLRRRPQRRWPGSRWWPGCEDGRPCDSALVGGRWLGVAPRVKKVLEMAAAEAAPSQAAPPHLMLAILDEGKGVACEILTHRGVVLADLAAGTRAQLE